MPKEVTTMFFKVCVCVCVCMYSKVLYVLFIVYIITTKSFMCVSNTLNLNF